MNTTPTHPFRSDATLLLAFTTILLWVFAASVKGQGTLDFCTLNQGDGINAPVRDPQGNPLGDQYYGQLYAFNPLQGRLTGIGTPERFRNHPTTGSGTGYLIFGKVSVPFLPPAFDAEIQLRAWPAGAGATYEAAVANGATVGSSPTIRVILGDSGSPPSPPPPLTGLQSFSLAFGPTLSVRKIGSGAISVEWTASGYFLQVATTFSGSWQDIPGASSPVSFSPTTINRAGFYRLNNGAAYSANIVGYVNMTLPAGRLRLIQNSMDAGLSNNVVSKVLASVPSGTCIYKFLRGSGGFVLNDYTDLFGWTDPDMSIAPGEGFFILAPPGSDVQHVFVGEVAVGKALVIPSGLSLIGSTLPQAGYLSALEYPANNESIFQLIDFSTFLSPFYSFSVSVEQQWIDPESGPTVAIGDAFWVENHDIAKIWTRSFKIN